MVSTKTNQRKTIGEGATKPTSLGSRRLRPSPRGERAKSRAAALRIPLMIVGLVFLALFIALVLFLILYFINNLKEPVVIVAENSSNLESEEEETVLPERIDFQPVIDEWAHGVGGNKSVLIYDLDRDEMVGEYNSKEKYNTASLYKLFVVYEGYRRLQSGEWQADDLVGSTGYTTLKCLDLAIRESYSPCAESLWAKIGQDNLDIIIENDFGILGSDISKLVSNPEDVMKIMEIFYNHNEITDPNLIATMMDSFLNQPATTYNWRQGLPSGFGEAKVFNKVGWDYNADKKYWNIYHDAAIVEFPTKERHYIVVVMTNQVPYQKIAELGSKIEAEFNKY